MIDSLMTQINKDLAEAGRIAAFTHREVAALAIPGVNLLNIEKKVNELIMASGASAAFLGYKGYPSASCLSVNSAVVHAIPQNYVLKSGDVLSVDLGVEKNGWIVDTAWSHAVGLVTPRVSELLSVTKRSLDEAIKIARMGNTTGDIGHVVQTIVEKAGFHIIRDLTGHGVGKELQMPPTIPNYGRAGTGVELKEGMILALEPITAIQPVHLTVENDNWTIRAHPDVVCAHFEHTIVITKTGPVILTKAA
ncbi:MAG: type I methionyl aminopeptidase [Candidatus Berkelbacteria bacterium]|nr:type I methionyl aminopeptidase [Candidatus Berkelbacteria bacterium]